MPYTQENRVLSIATPLAKDHLLLAGFTGYEALSRPFSFFLDLLSEDRAVVAFDSVLGKPMTIGVLLADRSTRHIHGVVSRFIYAGWDGRFSHYRAELVPDVALLSRTAGCRIFQQEKIPDILMKVLKENGITNVRQMLQGTYEPREYCVQYRETDLNFLMRLMEQYGITWFFEHSADKHTLVMADFPEAHKDWPDLGQAHFAGTRGGKQERSIVTEWNFGREVRPTNFVHADYDFENPRTRLSASAAGRDGNAFGTFEVYEYPGEFATRSEGEALAKMRIEEEQHPGILISGTSNCRYFSAGFRFALTGHRDEMNRQYVLTEVSHTASIAGTYEGHAGAADQYSNSFRCVPADTPFRPPRITPKPMVQGPQTAVVVGPEGEEIAADKYGRVRVHFPWDRDAPKQTSSCWIRVSQPWAGKGWGALSIPRVGQEVIVEFLEGDPDRPLITGRVYNAENMPPYDPSNERTKTTMKTCSSKGGNGYNELRFEDAKGKEQLYVHAERDLETYTKHDRVDYVAEEAHLKVGKDRMVEIGGDDHLTVTGDWNTAVTGTVSLSATQDIHTRTSTRYALQAGTEVHLKGGMNVVLEAGVTLTLKVGGNFININPAGVFISGTMVMINSGGSAGTGSGASPQSAKKPRQPGEAPPAQVSPPAPPEKIGATAAVLKRAAVTGAPFCDI